MNAKLSKIISETVAENNALNKVLATNASGDIFTPFYRFGSGRWPFGAVGDGGDV